jgi:hypothetical protein
MDPPKLSRGKTEVSRERNGFEPEFRGPLVVVNVDICGGSFGSWL